MADQRLLTCPLCGFEFVRADALCRHGCPLGAMCHLARCPACEYEFPERQPDRSWLARLFGRKVRPLVAAEDALTVRELASGETAEVISLEGGHPGRRHHLAVFGLVPGAEIRLVQRYPSYVVEIGETTLALDADVAADIVVARGVGRKSGHRVPASRPGPSGSGHLQDAAAALRPRPGPAAHGKAG